MLNSQIAQFAECFGSFTRKCTKMYWHIHKSVKFSFPKSYKNISFADDFDILKWNAHKKGGVICVNCATFLNIEIHEWSLINLGGDFFFFILE